MHKYIYFLILLFSSVSYAETYDENGYCETDKYQELKKCLRHNIDLVQKELDRLSNVYAEELKKDGVEGIEEANREWQEYTSSMCSLHAKSAGSGSIKPIRSMSCQLHSNERRVLELGCLISYHLGDGSEYQRYCKAYFDTRSKT